MCVLAFVTAVLEDVTLTAATECSTVEVTLLTVFPIEEPEFAFLAFWRFPWVTDSRGQLFLTDH